MTRKIHDKEVKDAFQRFDALTALGCSMKKKEFDAVKCGQAWDDYNDLLERKGLGRIKYRPMGI